MTAMKDLIAQCFGDPYEVEQAVAHLAEHGHTAVVAVLEHAEHTMVPAPAVLIRVIAAAADEDSVEYLISILSDSRSELSHTALRALGYIGNRQATDAIVNQLVSPDTGPFVCVPAATALAMLRDPAAKAPLRELLEHWGLRHPPVVKPVVERILASAQASSAVEIGWPLMVAVALAALGDQEAAPLAFEIVALPKVGLAAVPDGSNLFSFFCAQLRHLAAPGFLAACRAAFDGADDESKEVIAQVLGRAGTRDALAMLVDIAQDKAVSVSQVAAAWLGRIGDAQLSATANGHYGEPARAWWGQTSERFQDGVVYWSGKPWTPDVLFDSLLGEALEPDEDLLVVTGIHLGQEMRRRGLSRAETIRTCRAEAKRALTTGGLYRYGYRFDPGQL
jgi:HEAT repeat protein